MESHSEVLESLELLLALVVRLQELSQLGLGLVSYDLAVSGLHDNPLEDSLERLHVGVLSLHEDHWATQLSVHFLLGLTKLLPELLLHYLCYVSSVVLHEQASISVGTQVELNDLSGVVETTLHEFVNSFLGGIELVEDQVTVTLSNPGKGDLYHVFLTDGLLKFAASDFKPLYSAHKQDKRSKCLGVLYFLLRGCLDLGGTFFLGNWDSFRDFLNLKLLLALEIRESLVVFSANLGLIFVELQLVRVLSGLYKLSESGSQCANFVALQEELDIDVPIVALGNLLVEEPITDEVLIGEVVLDLGL